MTWSVCRDKYRFDAVVLHHFLEGGIRLRATALFGQLGAAVREEVGDGDHFDIWVVLKSERRTELTEPIAGNPNANFAIRNRLPAGRSRRLLWHIFQARNCPVLRSP